LKPFAWSAWYQKIAATTQHPSFGRLEVLHNGQPVGDVYSGRILIENHSNTDFGNLNLKIAYQESTEILGAIVLLEGSVGELSLTEQFVRIVESTDQAIAARAKNIREYVVPAFNRARKVDVYLILKRNDDKIPIVSVACDYVGVDLQFRTQEVLHFGVPFRQAQIAGLFLTLLFVAAFLTKLHSRLWLAFASWLAGALLLFLVAYAIRFVKWLSGQLG
jgi:hypothetical protein